MASRPIADLPLAVLLAAWGGAVALAAADGVFARLPAIVDGALAAFAAAYAVAVYALDADVRHVVHRAPRAMLALGVACADAALALVVYEVLSFEPQPLAALTRWPLALVAFFAMPLALAATVAALNAFAAARLSSSAARSPGGSPAAT